ncbi:MAG: hypothetical protein AB7P33_15230 [Dehalococcoidia bacterium]
MVLVYLKNGECIEVAEADAARRDDAELICLDSRSNELARFDLNEVETFTTDEKVAEMIKEEDCEDLTVINTDAERSTASRN